MLSQLTLCTGVIVIFFLIVYSDFVSASNVTIDKNGYIVYCPCMGRFGNQAEQFLGSLLFAKYLDRTLVLPPFVEYRNYQVIFSPFDDFFQLEPIRKYHRVIAMEDFMENIAPTIWPENERYILCYDPRRGDKDRTPGCNPFDGSPFKPFWYNFNITRFRSSVFHQPLVTQFSEAKLWKSRFKHINVLAFVGAPSAFPTNEEAIPLQKYLHYTDSIAEKAAKYRAERGFSRKPYLAIHLRHGSDWVKACSLLKENDMSQLFSSNQCTNRAGIKLNEIKLPYEVCSHSVRTIIKDIKRALTDGENTHRLEVIYVATDYNNELVWDEIHRQLPDVKLVTPTLTYHNGTITRKHSPPHYIIDTYLLAYSNYFIGNCISSFSAFASRIRLQSFRFNRTTQFFANDLLYPDQLSFKDEL
ncbi:GDP-fucose protein O-fucosyltransferase 1-like [Panonychus citri]|uniref:GDP-fucose protein O-fucosyltransferase 1-like n=1 Tax=Panonychus citri TaxID=50023 RepID=UPI0023071E0D|nr:GDP-fucose protein O-fucosyltransferase 1-like [Panonychus citri]